MLMDRLYLFFIISGLTVFVGILVFILHTAL
jgi:hypothetical protein